MAILFQKQYDGKNGNKLVKLFKDFKEEHLLKYDFSMNITKDLFGEDLLVVTNLDEGVTEEIPVGGWIVIFHDGNVAISREKLEKDPADEFCDDMVNHPPHYNKGSIEVIDYIRETLGDEGFVSYCWGNSLKYLSRANFKGKRDEDLKKARWYIDKLCEVIE